MRLKSSLSRGVSNSSEPANHSSHSAMVFDLQPMFSSPSIEYVTRHLHQIGSLAPSRLARASLAPSRLAPSRLASSRLAPSSLARARLAPSRLAPTRLAPARLAPTRLAPTRLAPTRLA